MRPAILMGRACAVFAFACTPAFAQGTVTLYGLLDAGVNYLSNAQTGRHDGKLEGGSKYSLEDGSTGGQNGSRWGLLGTEELGGGWRAVFRLEGGFTINNGALGQGGAEMGRQAYVGLASPYGTVTAGRQYDFIATRVGTLAASTQWAGYISGHASDVDNFLHTRRINNAVKYTSPDYRGLSLGAMYSFGGVAGSVGHQQIWSAGLGYANGPFTFGAAYLNARNPNLSFYGSNPSAGTSVASMNTGSVGSATSPESNPAYAGYASASTLQIAAAGGAWRLGPVTLGATYSNVQFRGLGDTATSGPNPFGYSGTATFNVGELNIRWQLSPAFLLGTAYSYVHNGGADGRDSAIYRQGSLGADYLLSKRTDVYSIVVYQHASGTDSLNQSAVASISGQTASANNHQLAVRFGLRHRF